MMESADIQGWIDYFGGMNVIYCILVTLAGTQLWKMLLRAFGRFTVEAVRPMPYLIGAFAGLVLIDMTSRGAMIGLSCGFISSLGWFVIAARLETGSWQEAGKRIGTRMMEKRL